MVKALYIAKVFNQSSTTSIIKRRKEATILRCRIHEIDKDVNLTLVIHCCVCCVLFRVIAMGVS